MGRGYVMTSTKGKPTINFHKSNTNTWGNARRLWLVKQHADLDGFHNAIRIPFCFRLKWKDQSQFRLVILLCCVLAMATSFLKKILAVTKSTLAEAHLLAVKVCLLYKSKLITGP